MRSEVLRNLIAIVVMMILYATLVFSKGRKASRGTKK